MSTLARRVAKIERDHPPPKCRRCDGKWIGVQFHKQAHGDYDGPNAPFPFDCPDCGRRIPKLYILPDRACWDAMVAP